MTERTLLRDMYREYYKWVRDEGVEEPVSYRRFRELVRHRMGGDNLLRMYATFEEHCRRQDILPTYFMFFVAMQQFRNAQKQGLFTEASLN